MFDEKDIIELMWSYIIFGEVWRKLSKFELFWSIIWYPVGVAAALFIIFIVSLSMLISKKF